MDAALDPSNNSRRTEGAEEATHRLISGIASKRKRCNENVHRLKKKRRAIDDAIETVNSELDMLDRIDHLVATEKRTIHTCVDIVDELPDFMRLVFYILTKKRSVQSS
jgi:hypothetical protein